MTGHDRSALVLGRSSERAERLLDCLRRAGLEVRRSERAAEAFPVVLESGTDLLVVALPLRGAERVLAALRLRGSASRGAAAVVIGAGDGHDYTDGALGRMANRMLPADCSTDELERAVAELLRVEPRAELPAASRPRLRLEPGGADLEVVNLSTSGLFVRALDPPQLGEELGFALILADGSEPIRGRARVVRVERPWTRDPSGFAIRILALEGDGSDRLRGFVEHARAEDEARGPAPAAMATAGPESARPAEPSPELDDLLRRGLTLRVGASDWLLTAAGLGLDPTRATSALLESARDWPASKD